MTLRPFDLAQGRPEPVIELRGVRKNHSGLRPLRIERFVLRQGETVALLGFDRAAAEVLVNLITAATLPDAGDVEIFGAPTPHITDSDTWLRSLDRFGILSERTVLVDELSVEQNLALPLSFEVDDMPADLRSQVGKIADEVGIPVAERRRSMGAAGPVTRTRVRLGKALALDPQVLLAEHPNAGVPPDEVSRLAGDLAAVASRRGLAVLVLTADTAFARAVCDRVLTLRPATGELASTSGWRGWFAHPVR
ncbi:MAG: ATP-binding cassette domain-containing protein [Vicinamibacterales bacterium]